MRSLQRAWYRLVAIMGVNRVTAWLHPLVYRWTDGRGPLGRQLGMQVLLLTTTGARTGRTRTAPLWTFPHGSNWVVVASRGGHPRAPSWYVNLLVRPDARIRLGANEWAVRAREATGAEYARLWQAVNASYPGYEFYRQRSGRRIPIMILERVRPASTGVSEPAQS